MTTFGRPYETLKPPPIETLAVAYLTPLMAPLRVLTRLPPNNPDAETPQSNAFINVSASSGTLISGSILFNAQVVLVSYAEYNDEITAEDNISTALAWMGNAQGCTITANNYDWFVSYSNISALPHRVSDPETPITGYRGAVVWRIAGQPISSPV